MYIIHIGYGKNWSGLALFILLDHDQKKFFVWGTHDLVLARADAQKLEIIGGVNVAHCAPCLEGQGVDEAGILHSGGVVKCRLDGDAL